MAEYPGGTLPYGQFGLPNYDPDDKEWIYDRSPKRGHDFKLLGEPKIVILPSTKYRNTEKTPAEEPSRRHARQAHELAKRFPETLLASDLIPSAVTVSEYVEAATTRHEPLEGNVLAFGRIPSQASHHSAHVVAYPGGDSGNEIHLAELRPQKQGWDDPKRTPIEVPTIRGEKGSWSGSESAILQICFAQVADRSDAFMAVRTAVHTTVFRPMVRKTPIHAFSVSRMDLNPILDIPIEKTGNVPHADIAFNVFYAPQAAVVDQAGRWSVWEVQGVAKASLKCLVRPQRLNETRQSKPLKPIDDGWARITWCGGPAIVCISSRHQVSIFDIAESLPILLHDIKSDSWILDTCLLASKHSHICILTSTNVEMYKVDSEDGVFKAVHKVIQWRHFRNPEDLSLRLSLTANEDDVIIFIRSSNDAIVVTYRIRIEDNKFSIIADPTDLALPQDGAATGVRDMRLEALSPQHKDEDDQSDEGNVPEQTQYYGLWCLQKDNSLRQALYASAPERVIHHERPPTHKSKVKAAPTQLLNDTGFVVDDEELDFKNGEQPRRPVSVYSSQRSRMHKSKAHWTVNYEIAATDLGQDDLYPKTSVTQTLDGVNSRLQEGEVETALPLQTIRDRIQEEANAGDVEELSSQLQELVLFEPQLPEAEEESEIRYLKLRGIVIPSALRIGLPIEDSTLAQVYDQMVQDWITPLPDQVQGRIRLAKDRALRRAATEVTLATYVMRIESKEPAEQPEAQPASQFELPVRRAGSPTGSTPSAYYDASSQFATSQAPSQASNISGPSYTTSASARSMTYLAPRLARMSKYTTFTTPPTPLPRSLETVLSHWTVGADPEAYDWLTETKRLKSRRDAEDEDDMDERDRARLQRRAERHIRRQRREAEESQRALEKSSQMPALVSASQQQQPARGRGGEGQKGARSQVVPVSSQGVGVGAASQVVPGRFGGRPVKKKVKRKSGF